MCVAAARDSKFAFFLWSKGADGKYAWDKVDCSEKEEEIHGIISSARGLAAVFSEEAEGYYVESRDHHEELMRGILTAKWTPATADVFRVNIFTYNDESGLYEKGAYTVDRYKLAGKFGQLLRDAGDASRRTGICLGFLDVALWAYTYVSQSAGWMSGSAASPLCILFMLLFGSMLYGFGLLLQYAYERRYGHTEAAA
jgi:hypothetical protein